MSDSSINHGEVIRTLQRIEAQVMKTNGRVTSLEKWRYIITGGMIVIGGIGAANISLAAKLFLQ